MSTTQFTFTPIRNNMNRRLLLLLLLLVFAIYPLPSDAKNMQLQPKGSSSRYLRKSHVASDPKIHKGDDSDLDHVEGPSQFDEAKTSWPEVVGMTGEQAKNIIEQETVGLLVVIIPADSYVTTDYRLDRVRIFVNTDGIVVGAPTLG